MKVKGVALRHTLQGLEKLHGRSGLEAVRAVMPPRYRDMCTTVMPLEWYPVQVSAALHTAIRDVLGGGKTWDESRVISAMAAEIELNGVYRLILRAVQYDTVWDRMERMWSQYYDQGEAKWVERERGRAVAQFNGVSGFNDGMWFSVVGRVEKLLDKTGARGAAITLTESATTRASIEAMWLE